MTLPDAIEHFLQEFAFVENRFVPTALGALTNDQTFIDRAQRRLDLPARLTLLKRMAMVRDANSSSIALIEGVIEKTLRLQEKREQLARSSEVVARDGGYWFPTASELHSVRNGNPCRPAHLEVRCRQVSRDGWSINCPHVRPMTLWMHD